MLFRLKQIIRKVSAVIDTSLRLVMAAYGQPHDRLRTEEDQPFLTGYPPQTFGPGSINDRRPYPVVYQIPPDRQEQVFNWGCAPNGHQPSPQRVRRLCSFFSRESRRRNKSCDSLPQNLCWMVANVVLTCGVVFCLLFILKHWNSSLLLRSEESDTETFLVDSSAQSAWCRPCPKREQDDSSPKQSNCCSAVDPEILRKLIEKMAKEAISAQLPSAPQKRNDSDGKRDMSGEGKGKGRGEAAAQGPCGALFFLYDATTTTTVQQANAYSVLNGWGDGGNVAYRHNSCISHDSSTGEVTISQSGFYFVYSHLAFSWQTPTDNKSRVLGHQIRVQFSKDDVDKTDELIAKDTRAIQLNDPEVGNIPTYNSHTMKVVWLPAKAKLTVQAKPLKLVMRNNDFSSFGLFKVL